MLSLTRQSLLRAPGWAFPIGIWSIPSPDLQLPWLGRAQCSFGCFSLSFFGGDLLIQVAEFCFLRTFFSSSLFFPPYFPINNALKPAVKHLGTQVEYLSGTRGTGRGREVPKIGDRRVRGCRASVLPIRTESSSPAPRQCPHPKPGG